MTDIAHHESLVKEMETLEKALANLRARLEDSLAERAVSREEFLRAYA